MCIKGGMVEKVQEGFAKFIDGASGSVVLAAIISAAFIGYRFREVAVLEDDYQELKQEVVAQRNIDQTRALDMQAIKQEVAMLNNRVTSELAEIKAILMERTRDDYAKPQTRR